MIAELIQRYRKYQIKKIRVEMKRREKLLKSTRERNVIFYKEKKII